MREIATLIEEHSTLDLSFIIDRLSWLAFKYAFSFIDCRKDYWETRRFVKAEDGTRKRNIDLAQPIQGLSILAAAAHLDLFPLVSKVLKEGHSPELHNYMFPSALEAVAWAGNHAMAQTLQSHIANQPGFAGLDLISKWMRLTGNCVIIGAAIRGDLAFLKCIMYPLALASPSETTLAGEPVGQIPRESRLGSAIYAAQRSTKSVEIHKCLQDFLKESLTDLYPDWLSRDFCNHCEWGNISMVEYFLDNGVNPNSP
ncbi:hypothetical protein ONS96_010649 [Cadophora gregata f. sp. sojae]|nr:hypothetical protein ONS96_010649 [Cadophora gregata f. sp. sojae]